MLLVLPICISIYIKSVLRYKFVTLESRDPKVYGYVSKYAKILAYFSRPKGICEQKRLGNTGLDV
jgi:hypothetical protein